MTGMAYKTLKNKIIREYILTLKKKKRFQRNVKRKCFFKTEFQLTKIKGVMKSKITTHKSSITDNS